MRCPNCQTDNRGDANFCRRCGHALGVVCPRCQTALLADSRFCDHCGFQLDTAPEAIPSKAPTTPFTAATSAQGQLERYMSREFAAKLEAARTRSDSAGERRVVTILFCDVKGSTAAAEQLDPEIWTDIMNGAFEFMIKPVYHYEGIVTRLVGDAIVALFGAPLAHEDDPERGVMAGLGILDGIQTYRETIFERHGIDFNVRVGMNTGLVFVGTVGSDLHMEYTAMGDAINVAARMEQTATPGTVHITDATYRLIAPFFNVEALPDIEVKGKSAPIRNYRVVSRSDVRSETRGVPGLESVLIGRDREQAQLKSILNDAQRGVGRIVFIEGEAGLGKSRLQRVAAAEWAASGDPWLMVSGLSYESQRAYSLIQDLICELMQITPTEGGPALREALSSGLSEAEAETRHRQERVLWTLFGVNQPDEASAESEQFRQIVVDVCRALIAALQRPAVLVVNDLHWADASSVTALQSLLALTDDHPLVFLFALRPERDAPGWQIRSAVERQYHHRMVELRLAPLSDEQAAAMMSGLLDGATLPAALVAKMVERAGGNPFYVEELVRSLIDAGVVTRAPQTDGGAVRMIWQAMSDSAEFEIPDNLHTLLNARLDRLEDEAHLTLQLASVIGRNFYQRVLAAVDAVGPQLDANLRTLQQLDMIEEAARVPELEYRFRNPLIQEAVYQTMLLRRRREFHLRVGEAMERLFSDRAEEFSLRLAHHFAEGDDHARAQRYYRMAADHADRLFAHTEAIAHYADALLEAHAAHAPADALIDLYSRLGRSFELANRFAEAAETYDTMIAESAERGEPSLRLAGLLAQATIYGTQTPLENREKSRALTAEALEMARSLGDRAAEAKALWNLMLASAWQGDDQGEALRYGEASLAISRELNLREQTAFTLTNLGIAYANSGKMEGAVSSTLAARDLWRELNNRTMEGDSYSLSSWLRAAAGQLDGALEDAAEGIRLSHAIGNLWNQVAISANQGIIYATQGQFGRALAAAEMSLKLATEAGLSQALSARVLLAFLYIELGANDQARALADGVLAERAETSAPLDAFAYGFLARTLIRLGQLDAAASALADLQIDFDDVGKLSWINGGAYAASAALLVAQGAGAAASQRLTQIVERMQQTGNTLYLSDALSMLSLAYRVQERPIEAAAALDTARAAAEQLGAQRVLWRILAAQCDIRAQAGDAERAAALSGQVRALLDSIASNIPSEDLRASFLAQDEVQAALASTSPPAPCPTGRERGTDIA